MQKWEYLVTGLIDDKGDEAFIESLNKGGELGWELCVVLGEGSFLRSKTYIFKRLKCS